MTDHLVTTALSISQLPGHSYGVYENGPSYVFFDELFKHTSNDNFIVEDLGSEIEKTIELRDHYNLMGMKVLQYVFDGYEYNILCLSSRCC